MVHGFLSFLQDSISKQTYYPTTAPDDSNTFVSLKRQSINAKKNSYNSIDTIVKA